jgi:hypothetical protein
MIGRHFRAGFYKGAERPGLLVSRKNLVAEIDEARAHPFISARASTAAALSLPTISFGVALGAKSLVRGR